MTWTTFAPAVVYAHNFPGRDAGEQIVHAIGTLSPTRGGIVDCTGLGGEQTISRDIFAGITGPGELLLGVTTYKLTVPQLVPSNWTIRGVGSASQFTCDRDLPSISGITPAVSALIYVKSKCSGVTIRDLTLRGPYTSGAAGTTCGIFLSAETTHCEVLRCKIHNMTRSGIRLWPNYGQVLESFKSAGHLIDGNYTEGNAINGIDVWGINCRIVNNYSFNDAVAADGTASIELHNGSSGCLLQGNTSWKSKKSGIELTIGPTANVQILNNQIFDAAVAGIVGAQAWSQFAITGNMIDTTRGGDGIHVADCLWFRITDNQVLGAAGVGIALSGTTNNAILSHNFVGNCYMGIGIWEQAGRVGAILVTNNRTRLVKDHVDFENAAEGDKIYVYLNAFGDEFHVDIPGI
jgi:hypothetical protein